MLALNLRRILLVVGALLSFALASSGQPIATVSDASCVVAVPCAGIAGHGCTSTQFTVPTTGSYILTASMSECAGGYCSECKSEAYICLSDYPTTVIDCISTEPSCCTTHGTGTHVLYASRTYILYCCKVDCDINSCDNCRSECVAWATVQ